jgi:D-alanine-D-alanine ligase
VEHVAIFDDLDLVRQKLQSFAPDVIFNLADQFNNNRAFDQNIVSFLELQGVPFTGCGATGLMLCKNKGISKKILGYHRIHVPDFVVLHGGRKISKPARLKYPLLVKPLKEEASLGIAQASHVTTDEEFKARVQFLFDTYGQDVIAEEYIEGRELYVSLLGGKRLRVFPFREMVFAQVPEGEPRIATYKAKWDAGYRKRWGIENRFATDLDPALVRRIEHFSRRVFRLLGIDGYARMDLRLTPQGEIVFIEANPNPMLAREEDFAQSALKAGLKYPALIQHILQLGLDTERG